jgi:hypothetical protein
MKIVQIEAVSLKYKHVTLFWILNIPIILVKTKVNIAYHICLILYNTEQMEQTMIAGFRLRLHNILYRCNGPFPL